MTRAVTCLLTLSLVTVVPAVIGAQGTAAASQPSSAAGALTLADLEQMALANSPVVAQATADIAAARGRAVQAGLLPNPTIGYTGEEISRGPVIRGGEHGLFVEQTIPLGGKLGLSRRIFEREASQFEAIRESQQQRVVNDVRILFYEALAAQRRVEVQERLTQLAATALGTSGQLFNTGAADRPDVLDAEVEVRTAQLRLETARNDQTRIWRRLAATVGEAALTVRPLVGSIDTAIPELDRDALVQRVLEQSPEMKAARAGIERADAALARARREPAPDLVLRGGPRNNRELLEAGGRPVGWEAAFDVGLTVPLFNRNQGNIAAARAELTRAQQELTRLDLALRARVADAFDEYLTNLRRAETYRDDVIPRAQRSYELYLARYREMGAAFPQVLVAQRTFFQVSNEYVDAAVAAWRSALELQGFLLTGSLEAGAGDMSMMTTRESGSAARRR